jgi:hypothetical protein
LDHPTQILLTEAAAELQLQLSPQCGDNLFPVFCSALREDIDVNAGADLPIQLHQGAVDIMCDRSARFYDQGS